jgi:hypothetical protein
VIAYFQLVLPGEVLVLADEPLPPLTMEGVELEGVGQVEVIVYPPYRSRRSLSAFRVGDATPLGDDPDALNPVDPQPVEPMVVIDGAPAVRCDVIAVEVHGEDFDRRRATKSGSSEVIQPLLDLACEAANGVLQVLRVLTRAPHLKPIGPQPEFRMVFLDDDRKSLPEEADKIRGRGYLPYKIQLVAVTPGVWGTVPAVGGYEIPAWEELLLDAKNVVLEEIGPPIVLAAAAVETRIRNALDVLAAGKVPADVWQWTTTRGGDFTKTPLVAEMLDTLLLGLGGRSLREDPRLWKAGDELRQARNAFVHGGRAVIARKKRRSRAASRMIPVTRDKVLELVDAAGEIIDFIELLLPESERRPRLSVDPRIETTVVMRMGPATEEAAGQGLEP